jgi:hypothetical protein
VKLRCSAKAAKARKASKVTESRSIAKNYN